MNADKIRLHMDLLDMGRSGMIHRFGSMIYFDQQQNRKEVFVS
jgi:hypothetical protein